ncbi:hypothetical protein [Arthrobacter sp. SLBN-112]|uniref:hypothetical protein n=1 Tax=Arthrobacter sp. SLBN-112 TaxID=2768452 RepID=UPI002811564E|nr:hypothetical protein [Arthrobacter sp. SLBN-112]
MLKRPLTFGLFYSNAHSSLAYFPPLFDGAILHPAWVTRVDEARGSHRIVVGIPYGLPDSLERSSETVILIGLVYDDDGPTGPFEGLVSAPIDPSLRFQKVMAAVVLNSNSVLTKAEIG